MEQYIHNRFDKDEWIPRGAEVDAIVERALAYAVAFLNDVWECDTLAFWASVDSNDVYCWMQEDAPALAESVRKKNLKQKFHRRLTERLYLWGQAETMVRKMPPLDMQSILAQSDEKSRIEVVKKYIDEKAYVDTDRWQFGQGDEDEDDYADDWDDSDEDDGYEDFAIETIASEALRIVVGRQKTKSSQTANSTPPFIETTDTCAVIDEARNSLTSATTFYMIDDDSMPTCLQGKSREKRSIVVKVSDHWLDNPSRLSAFEELEHRFVRVTGNVAPLSVFAVGTSAVWFDAQKAMDVFRLLRHEIPVLYVGSVKSVFVVYSYSHFADLGRLWSKTMNADLCSREVTLQQFATRFPDGSVVAPALKRNVVDLT
ncbi:hypothetical protein B0G80_8599 [Paraburkholderia sp. BL6669N2]|uniref:hypothetical protein n=1 Tax=Paraburkholderia sp. BL6669N2 TaxID=1938807 RepID=UPI000E22212E|nr:hypothetical protein [Paraburkholderia sp. BL6669N2]REG52083.1 hypothetical protein B0G80_8599 [Paraburkholderia sp. BL6669N2]